MSLNGDSSAHDRLPHDLAVGQCLYGGRQLVELPPARNTGPDLAGVVGRDQYLVRAADERRASQRVRRSPGDADDRDVPGDDLLGPELGRTATRPADRYHTGVDGAAFEGAREHVAADRVEDDVDA